MAADVDIVWHGLTFDDYVCVMFTALLGMCLQGVSDSALMTLMTCDMLRMQRCMFADVAWTDACV